VFAYDMANDEMSKPVHPAFPVSTTPMLYHNLLIAAGLDGRLVSLDLGATERRRRLLASLDGPIMEPPIIADGKLYAAAHGDMVLEYDLASDHELNRWAPDGPAGISSGVAVADGYVYVGDNLGMVYALSTAASVLDPQSQHLASAAITGTPQVRDGLLFALTEAPSVLCLTTGRDMKLLWEHEGTAQLLSWGKGRVYVRQQDGSIEALSTEDGSAIWHDPLPAACKAVGDLARPVFYLANSAGSVTAFAELD
jgi:outer membrane protein assembly factor BamB